jgi:dipeptidyl-peptidase 4
MALGLEPLQALPAITWTSSKLLWFQTSKNVIRYDLEGSKVEVLNSFPEGAENTDYHKASANVAFTVGSTLMVAAAGDQLRVAESEMDGIVYGKSVHREEFGIAKGTFWSNSGQKLAFYRMDESMVTQYPIYILDSMPAQVRNVRYPYAGAKSHQVTLGIYDLKSKQTLYLQTGEPQEQYLTNIAWTPDDRYVLVAVVNRSQDHLNQYDAGTGAFVKTLFEEKNDKWVEPEKPAIFVKGSKDQFVWHSERNGFNQLYLMDLSGRMIRQISKGDAPVTAFYGFDEYGEHCYYQMADESGLNRYVYSAKLATGQSSKISIDEGTHNALVSSTGKYLVDIFHNLVTPRLAYVQSTQKPESRQVIFGAPNPLANHKIGSTQLVKIPSVSGMGLNGRLITPPDFDSKKQYPAIVYVYNGPHVQMVTNTWLGNADLWMYRLAQEGFVVFALDGRGSAHRGLRFEGSVHRQLGLAEMEDQLTGVSYLKAQGYIDPARIGVYGWSYGGFMATSLMTRPEAKDIFKCGIGGGPVLDWRMYEIMYTERYMDHPEENKEGYEKSSLFNYIDNLNRPLMLIHGSSDDVVLWQNSLRYIRECVKKGRPIDYFAYPEHLHNVIGKDRVHLFEKIEQYFKDKL